jgi:hypothetical protein
MQEKNQRAISLLLAAGLAAPLPALAGDTPGENWNAHIQTTYVWQAKPSFSAPYTGDFSLRPEREKSYSFSATAAFGWRPWQGGELYFDPELLQGVPLSGLTGLGGMANAELAKSSGSNPKLYRARLFLRQTWNLGGGSETVESDMNQLAGMVDKHRIVLTAGNFSVMDVFDNSAYAHDTRTQFMNGALTTYGAWDYPADARGYTWGAAVEYYRNDWALRAGRFMQPAESNGLPLDTRIFRHYGDQIEIEHAHTAGGQPGKLRVLAFRNRANMGSFRDALDLAAKDGTTPDVSRVRTEHVKYGYGLGVDQNLAADVAVFGRASWNDGATETYAFTEIERSLSAGLVVKGGAWQRSDDTLGIAFARNGLSSAHRDYMAAGGHGAFIGDGRLNYASETIVEMVYSARIAPHFWLSLDAQHIANPAYNADRGPVKVAGIRLHADY